MKIIKKVFVTTSVLAILTGLSIGLLVLRAPSFDGPLSRIAGGPFSQSSEEKSVSAKALTNLSNLELEVQLDSRPSVTVAVLVENDQIYLPATLTPNEKRWPEAIQKDPKVRIRVANLVYDFNAYLVSDAALHRRLSDLGAEKYSPSYFIPEKTWFFHLTRR